MAQTTVVPFASLPSCAAACYHLYDANGACVPPAVAVGRPEQYAACFCANSLVAPFSTGTAGVCDDACTAPADQGGLNSIHTWYSSYCSNNAKAVATAKTVTVTSTSSGSGKATGTSSSSSGSGHSTWLSTHWQWVIFIVVVVVGIVGIWVGACIWHRRYMRRKDRQYALRNIRASTGAASGTTGLRHPSSLNMGGAAPAAGVFGPGTEGDAEKHQSTGSRQRV